MPSEVSIRAVLQGFDQARSGLLDFTRQFEDLGKSVQTASTHIDDFGNKWSKSMNEAEQATARFDAGVKIVAASITGLLATAALYAGDKLFDAFKRVSDGGEQLYLMSQRTGLAAESLSELGLAARTSGLTMEDLGHSMERFSRSIISANTDTDQTGGAFKRLGISVTDANGQLKSNEQLLREVADAFAGAADGAAKTEIAIALFSRGGAQMIPVLNKGAAGMDELREAAKKAGIVLSNDSVKAAHDLNESWAVLGAFADGFWNKIATPIVTGLAEITKAMANARKEGEGFFASLWAGLRTTDLLRDRRKDAAAAGDDFFSFVAATGSDFDLQKPQLPGKDQTDKRIKEEQDTAKALVDIREASLEDYMVILQRQLDAFSDEEKRRIQIRQEMVKTDKAISDGIMQQVEMQIKAREDLGEEQRKAFLASQEEQRKAINDTAAVELRQAQAAVYWTREEQLGALQALANKYQELGPLGAQAFQRVQVAIARTRDDTQDFQHKLVQAFGPASFNDTIIGGLRDVRTSISQEFSAVLKGTESFADAMTNIFTKMKDKIIDTLAELAVNAGFRALLQALFPGNQQSQVAISAPGGGPPAPSAAGVVTGGLGALGPAGLGIAAAFALVIQLGTAEGRAQFMELIKGIPVFIREFANHLPEVIDALVKAAPKIVLALNEAILISVPGAMVKAAAGWVEAIVKGAAPFLEALVRGIGDGLKHVFDALIDGLKSAIKSLVPSIPGIGGGGGGVGGAIGIGIGLGPIGALFASGTDRIVTRPTLFVAGEAGAEHVRVDPMGGGGMRGLGSGGVYVDLRGAVMDSYSTTLWHRELARRLKAA